MHVMLGVGMPVVMPVYGGPPEDALLRGGLGQEGEKELESPARGIGAM
jgi:hypothetical protein